MIRRIGILLICAGTAAGCGKSSGPAGDRAAKDEEAREVHDWPLFRGNAEMQGISREDLQPPLDLVWTFEIPSEEGKRPPAIKASPVIGDGRVYFGGQDGFFYAVDLETGSLAWKLGVEGPVTAPAAYRDGRCFVGDTHGFVYGIDAVTGRSCGGSRPTTKWRVGINLQEIAGADGGSELRVYFGCHDFFLYCLSAENGVLRWKHETENYILATPSIDEEKKAAVFGGCDGFLHVISTVDGQELQKVDVGQYIPNSAAIRDGIAYVAHHGGEVLAVDLASGEVAWRIDTGVEYRASPAVTESAVIVGGTDKVLAAFDRVTGAGKWTFQATRSIESSPVVSGSVVWLGGMDGSIYAVSSVDGSELWSWDVGAKISASPAISVGRLVICGEDGIVYAFRRVPDPATGDS